MYHLHEPRHCEYLSRQEPAKIPPKQVNVSNNGDNNNDETNVKRCENTDVCEDVDDRYDDKENDDRTAVDDDDDDDDGRMGNGSWSIEDDVLDSN
uniref:ELM2 domain-containing protein n=1 Tax=Syphacia muris TaxID=451379 RepID=A0A0N5ABP4_9BILA